MTHRREFLIGSALALGAFTSASAVAQAAGPNRLVVGFAPGGGSDSIARLLSARMKSASGATFIVDNKPGAAGRLAIADVKNASADGRTLLITPDPMMTVYPLVYKKLNYDPFADFKPVTTVATVPMGIAVGPLVPDSVKTLSQFAAWLKANPGKAIFGTAGAGTTLHFIGLMFGKSSGLDFLHAPYRGSAPAVADVIGGQIASCVTGLGELLPMAEAGKLRVLAISSATRSRFLPNVPTFREAGHAELESVSWLGVFVPAKTADTIVRQVHEAIIAAANSNEVRQGMEKLGYEVSTSTPESFRALIRADIARWTPVVKATGYTAEE